jgi:hypothetical protein
LLILLGLSIGLLRLTIGLLNILLRLSVRLLRLTVGLRRCILLLLMGELLLWIVRLLRLALLGDRLLVWRIRLLRWLCLGLWLNRRLWLCLRYYLLRLCLRLRLLRLRMQHRLHLRRRWRLNRLCRGCLCRLLRFCLCLAGLFFFGKGGRDLLRGRDGNDVVFELRLLVAEYILFLDPPVPVMPLTLISSSKKPISSAKPVASNSTSGAASKGNGFEEYA